MDSPHKFTANDTAYNGKILLMCFQLRNYYILYVNTLIDNVCTHEWSSNATHVRL